ncbi:MAG: SpoIIE family protein phosphatase [Spirochaetia bacterium]
MQRSLFTIILLFCAPFLLTAQELFWEDPQVLVSDNVRFIQSVSSSERMFVAWQEFESTGEDTGRTWVSFASSTDGSEWIENRRFAGPFDYIGNQNSIYSLAVTPQGNILIAVSASEENVLIFRSEDGGESFQEISQIETETLLITPRLFGKADGGYLLFATRITENSLSIFYSRSEDGAQWTDFQQFVTEPGLELSFLPYHTTYARKEYVVFQTLQAFGDRQRYQIYLKISSDGGETWEEPLWLTGFEEALPELDFSPANFNNQRPYINAVDGRLAVTWERRAGSGPLQIYYAELNQFGRFLQQPDRVTDGLRDCRFPRVFYHKDTTFLTWFDNRRGENHIILARKQGLRWYETDISQMPGISTFGRAIRLNDSVFVLWENQLGNTRRLVLLEPDQSVPAPSVQMTNVNAGSRSNQDMVRLRWTQPEDSSGIAGYSYLWTQDPDARPAQQLRQFADNRVAIVSADQDGRWYFHIITEDYAGNWSQTSTISYVLDTTPPDPVNFADLETDEEGYLTSNTFTVEWEPPDNEDLAGYAYEMRYIGPADMEFDPENISIEQPGNQVETTSTQESFYNYDNGLWAFTVSTVDDVGNVSPGNTQFIRLNKYIPVTYITYVDAQQDALGQVNMDIYGRGFSVGGLIQNIYVDRDGQEPYDYRFELEDDMYSVQNDRLITGIEITEVLEDGNYRVGVVHPERGEYWTRPVLQLTQTGTVKFGDFTVTTPPGWRPIVRRPLRITFNTIAIVSLFVFLGLALLFTVQKVFGLVQEGILIQQEVQALVGQKDLPHQKKEKRMAELKSKGLSLRVKFVLLIILLVFIIVLILALALGVSFISTQRESLVNGLRQRSEVLLESLATGARSYLPAENRLELSLLPDQISAMGEEALWTTITGIRYTEDGIEEVVWASNDPELETKIEGENFIAGQSIIDDQLTATVQELAARINEEAAREVDAMAQEVSSLGAQALEASIAGDQELTQELERTINQLRAQINSVLQAKGAFVGSVPEFSPETVNANQRVYVFYKPVVYWNPGDEEYFKGAIRLAVSIDSILAETQEAQQSLIVLTGIIALIAIVLGVIGALVLATITVNPIRKLVTGVETIRDTDDKAELKEFTINIKSRDELSVLADTINQMTEGLVKAAVANKDLTVGKEVQKMFIPLEKDASGNKLTTGAESSDYMDFFGYYEGAKGVSGDYFYYQKLDDKHYAIIKCDVAGKGVPAALIMVQVATIFLNYLKGWDYKKSGIHLEQVVYQINDLLEERKFKGRFAAFTTCIVNEQTGKCYFSNAGDNIIHYYDAQKNKTVQKSFPETPAAGVFPNMLVEMKSGFEQYTHTMKTGDIMLLFTDGMEEAKRYFRNQNFQQIACNEPGMEEGDLHGTHYVGAGDEELSLDRMHAISDAVMHKTKYQLYKYHNPVQDEQLTFDFGECQGTVEEVVMALVSIEKVFRIYPDPSAGEEDRIQVDRKIDTFLKKHFDQYREYFTHSVDTSEESEYAVFSHLKEDEQYDDLTILGFKKK